MYLPHNYILTSPFQSLLHLFCLKSFFVSLPELLCEAELKKKKEKKTLGCLWLHSIRGTLSSLKSNSFWCAALHSQPPATQSARCARASLVTQAQAFTQHGLLFRLLSEVLGTACNNHVALVWYSLYQGATKHKDGVCSQLLSLCCSQYRSPDRQRLHSGKTHSVHPFLVPVALLKQGTLSKDRNSQ